MSLSSIGDLASTFIARRSVSQLNREMATLGTELTTGLRSDPRSAVSGDSGMISGIERSLTRVAAFTETAKQAGVRMGAMQFTLDKVQNEMDAVLSNVLLGASDMGTAYVETTKVSSAEAFNSVVAGLNTSVGGRYHFSGTETGTPPLRDAGQILAKLELLVADSPDAETMITTIEDYFGPTGAFLADDYQGSDKSLTPLEVAEGTFVSSEMRADDQSIRDALSGLAKAHFASSGTFTTGSADYKAVLASSGSQLRKADGELIAQRSVVGAGEARIEAATSRNATEDTALQQARLNLIGADRYETATRLQETELQLESLYMMTARMSRLSLTNYL